jgi:uncharacterized membrane protein YeaQ/YmgE (transglycosylase-associated protein family)
MTGADKMRWFLLVIYALTGAVIGAFALLWICSMVETPSRYWPSGIFLILGAIVGGIIGGLVGFVLALATGSNQDDHGTEDS